MFSFVLHMRPGGISHRIWVKREFGPEHGRWSRHFAWCPVVTRDVGRIWLKFYYRWNYCDFEEQYAGPLVRMYRNYLTPLGKEAGF